MSRCTLVFIAALAIYFVAAVIYDVREAIERRRSR